MASELVRVRRCEDEEEDDDDDAVAVVMGTGRAVSFSLLSPSSSTAEEEDIPLSPAFFSLDFLLFPLLLLPLGLGLDSFSTRNCFNARLIWSTLSVADDFSMALAANNCNASRTTLCGGREKTLSYKYPLSHKKSSGRLMVELSMVISIGRLLLFFLPLIEEDEGSSPSADATARLSSNAKRQ